MPVNTNYRYGSDELVYLWDNADVRAVVFHGEFSAQIELIHGRLPEIRSWLWVDDGTGLCPSWAVSYEEAALGTGEGPGPPCCRGPSAGPGAGTTCRRPARGRSRTSSRRR